ncbi:MAG: hypothetical protein WBA88_13915, partial [Pseudaminobacter sp.]
QIPGNFHARRYLAHCRLSPAFLHVFLLATGPLPKPIPSSVSPCRGGGRARPNGQKKEQVLKTRKSYCETKHDYNDQYSH